MVKKDIYLLKPWLKKSCVKSQSNFNNNMYKFQPISINMGANSNWDFRISDLIKNPDGIDI